MDTIDVLKWVAEQETHSTPIQVVGGVITNLTTGEVIDESLIAYQKTPTDGLFIASEATCDGQCSVGVPKQRCVDRGIYSVKKCSVYFPRQFDDETTISTDVINLKALLEKK